MRTSVRTSGRYRERRIDFLGGVRQKLFIVGNQLAASAHALPNLIVDVAVPGLYRKVRPGSDYACDPT